MYLKMKVCDVSCDIQFSTQTHLIESERKSDETTCIYYTNLYPYKLNQKLYITLHRCDKPLTKRELIDNLSASLASTTDEYESRDQFPEIPIDQQMGYMGNGTRSDLYGKNESVSVIWYTKKKYHVSIYSELPSFITRQIADTFTSAEVT